MKIKFIIMDGYVTGYEEDIDGTDIADLPKDILENFNHYKMVDDKPVRMSDEEYVQRYPETQEMTESERIEMLESAMQELILAQLGGE